MLSSDDDNSKNDDQVGLVVSDIYIYISIYCTKPVSTVI